MADSGGVDPAFKDALNRLVFASGGRVFVNNDYRSIAEQTRLWNDAVAKYGSPEAARKWVAEPGQSNHNRGIAADLGGDIAWAHEHAAEFGLTFPMSWEPWHIETTGARATAAPGAYTTPPTGSEQSPVDQEQLLADRVGSIMRGLVGQAANVNDQGREILPGGGDPPEDAFMDIPDQPIPESVQGQVLQGPTQPATIMGNTASAALAKAKALSKSLSPAEKEKAQTFSSAFHELGQRATESLRNQPKPKEREQKLNPVVDIGSGGQVLAKGVHQVAGAIGVKDSAAAAVERIFGKAEKGHLAQRVRAETGKTSNVPGNGSDVDKFLAATREHESGGNYKAHNDKGGAYGAYQIIPSTWLGWGGGKYAPRADMATPEQQDEIARGAAERLFNTYGSWKAVAKAWYTGDGNYPDGVTPHPEAGNTLKAGVYGDWVVSWMGAH